MSACTSFHGRRILVVEDHEDSRELLLEIARAVAADCVGAATTEQARRVFLERRPDVIITDYNLPDGNGLELLKWIRHDQQRPDVRAVLVSAFGDRDRLRAAAAEAFALFLPKPLDMRALHAAITASFERS